MKFLLVCVLAFPVFSATSINVTSGGVGVSNGPSGLPWTSMGSFSFRLEGRIHGWVSGDDEDVCVMDLCIRSITTDALPGMSATVHFTSDVEQGGDIAVSGCCAPNADIEYRIQRDLAKVNCPTAAVGCYTLEWWDVVNGTYNSAVGLLTSVNSNWAPLGGWITYINPGVEVAWLEMYTGVVPIGQGKAYCGASPSGPCQPNLTDAQTGDLASYKFEGNLNDSSGRGYNLTVGAVTYATTPIYGPSCNAGAQQVFRAGTAGTLSGYGLPRDGVTLTATYMWQQTAGPQVLWTGQTTSAPTISGLEATNVPGGPASYIFQLTTLDSSHNSTSCTVKDGGVATDNNYIVLTNNPVTDQLLHQQPMWGAPTQPWPWYDTVAMAANQGLLNNVYGLRSCTSLDLNTCYFQVWWTKYGAGTISVADGSNTVTGSGTNFLAAYGCTAGGSPSSGAPMLAVEYMGTQPATLHYRMFLVTTCTDATHVVLDRTWSSSLGALTGKYAPDNTGQAAQWSLTSAAQFPANFYDNVAGLYVHFLRTGIDDFYRAFQTFGDEWWQQPTMDQGECFGYVFTNPPGTAYCQAIAWRAHSMLGVVLRALDKGDVSPNGMWAGMRYLWDYTMYYTFTPALIGNRENGVQLLELALCAQFDPTFVSPSVGRTCQADLDIILSNTSTWSDPTYGGTYQAGAYTFLSASGLAASIPYTAYGTTVKVTNGSTTVTCIDSTNGGSGTCGWSGTVHAGLDQFWVIHPGYSPASSYGAPLWNSAGDSQSYSIASITDANHLTLTSAYQGTTSSGQLYAIYLEGGNPVLAGFGNQPFMQGIVGDGLDRVAKALAILGDSTHAAIARNFSTAASLWNRLYGFDSTLGAWYLRGSVNCPIVNTPGPSQSPSCSSGTDPDTNRILNAETLEAVQDEYLATGNPAAKAAADTYMNAMWAKPGTGNGNLAYSSDGYYVNCWDTGGYCISWGNGAAPWKWYGQHFGSSLAPAWAASRLLTPTPPGTGPTVAAWSPTSVYAGGAGFTLTVTGTNFAAGAVVQWNGAALPTTFVSAGQLTALVSANLIASAGAASLTVSSGGQTSTPVSVTIDSSAGLSFAHQRVTAQAPPASGCVVPSAASSFPLTTATVYLYFEATVPSGVTLSDDWVSFNGTVVSPNRFSAVSACYSASLAIGGLPATSLGSWQARVFANGSLLVSVPFTVGGTAPLPQPQLAAVTNAANYVTGVVSPGEIVALFGDGLGPAQLVQANLGASSQVSTQPAGTSVQFDDLSAPVLYTSATQVSAVVPYEVSGTTTKVTVTYQGNTSVPLSLPVQAAVPGLYTADSSGTGQLAAVNQDGSMNGSSTPAAAESIVTLFATGEGQTTPAGVDGKPVPTVPPFPVPVLPVQVAIDNVNATVWYAGEAPGEIAGIMQINVQIPPGVSGSAVSVVLSLGGGAYSSPPGTTIAVAAAGTSTAASVVR